MSGTDTTEVIARAAGSVATLTVADRSVMITRGSEHIATAFIGLDGTLDPMWCEGDPEDLLSENDWQALEIAMAEAVSFCGVQLPDAPPEEVSP